MTTSPEQFDLIIVGSGSGNSIPPELAGRKIALVERDPVFGGTCLNRGCIPSKMFVLPADLAAEAAHSSRLGVDVRFHGVDWLAIRDRVFGRIDAISQGGRAYRATGTDGLTLLEGTARFVDERVLDVDLNDGGVRRIAAEHVLLAVGSRPMVPDIPGLADAGYHTSDTIMRVDAIPARLGVIGGGFIAAEMGHVFASFGSQVTVFNRSMGMLTHHDRDVAARFVEQFGEHVDLRLGRVPEWVERRGDEIVLHDPRVEPVTVDALLVATGRVPNSDLIDAAAGNVNVADDGVIEVDAQMRTSAAGVWAIGDVANRWQLKHVANAEARVAFWNIACGLGVRGAPQTIDYAAVPSAVFSHPQIASAGMTERQAVEAGLDVVVGRRDYGGTAYGWALVDDTSFAKVIVDRSSGVVIGGHVLGPQAATLIQPLIGAIQFGQSAEELARGQYWIHPALTEVVENALLDALEQL